MCRKYSSFIEDSRTSARRSGQNRVPSSDHFITWLTKEPEFLESNDVHFKDLVRGPTRFATKYHKYCVNGFLFITKDYQKTKRNQNSGVSTSCMTTFRSSAKDKNPIDGDADYYGVLTNIVQLNYREGYKTVLFKCDWAKCTQLGVKIDEEANLRLVNLSNLLSSDRICDEPFILAEKATQVFYSQDPKNLEWHVVLEVPKKLYFDQDQPCLADERVLSDSDLGPSNLELPLVDELIFNAPEDMVEVVESSRKRRMTRVVESSRKRRKTRG